MKNFWLFEKHQKKIEITDYSSTSFRLMIDAKTRFKFSNSEDNGFNYVYDWNRIEPSFGFFFDFPDNEGIIRNHLQKSKLVEAEFIYVETMTNIPVIKVKTTYFVDNWIDFVNANAGQGSILLTDDMSLLMEFTDDRKYYLFSNFRIM